VLRSHLALSVPNLFLGRNFRIRGVASALDVGATMLGHVKKHRPRAID